MNFNPPAGAGHRSRRQPDVEISGRAERSELNVHSGGFGGICGQGNIPTSPRFRERGEKEKQASAGTGKNIFIVFLLYWWVWGKQMEGQRQRGEFHGERGSEVTDTPCDEEQTSQNRQTFLPTS